MMLLSSVALLLVAATAPRKGLSSKLAQSNFICLIFMELFEMVLISFFITLFSLIQQEIKN
jgi:hypothetical protein